MSFSGGTKNTITEYNPKSYNVTKIVKRSLISIVVLLYVGISIVSTYHAVDFFSLTNVSWASILLALMFELGQMGTLFLIASKVMQRINKTVVWLLFILLTGMQIMANVFYAYVHAEDFSSWIELFGLEGETLLTQKRILAIVSGALLPLIGLGFIKSLSDYLNPKEDKISNDEDDDDELTKLLSNDSKENDDGKTKEESNESVVNEESLDEEEDEAQQITDTKKNGLDKINVFKKQED